MLPSEELDGRVAPLVTSKIYDLASALLVSVADRLDDAGIDVPTRQYVHAGEVALDFVGDDCCSQLVVAVLELAHTMPLGDAEIVHCAPMRTVRLDVWLTRCVPTQDDQARPPSVADLDAASDVILGDLWTLPYVIHAGYTAGEWASLCQSVMFDLVEPYGPAGACGGVHAQVLVQLV